MLPFLLAFLAQQLHKVSQIVEHAIDVSALGTPHPAHARQHCEILLYLVRCLLSENIKDYLNVQFVRALSE